MIEVYDLWFDYDGYPVLKGLTFNIGNGEMVAIMGENGAGKTTLIKHFNGLLKPKRGYVKVFGIDTRHATVAQLSRKVGLIFQNPDHQLFAETVEEEVSFALKNFGFPNDLIKEKVERTLKLLGLYDFKDRSPFTLSGGERKRVTIASVLCYDPEIIIFDEPTVGQDYMQKEKLAQLIKSLHNQSKTVIVVTHDVEFVAENFPRVILLSNGRIIADGNTRRILTDEDLIKKANLILPQMTQVAFALSEFGFPRNLLSVSEVRDCIIKVFSNKR
ncbi:MAG: energy-coupling factor ABC transporter ATP-binding protein [Candidatus Methanomethylicia archaeon]|nr:energy-coupling factor ABC transporter ATP-binding protein [Candidatus Methanomethylicia archaeon]MCX8169030.1 energy-coupling factor ABC transporter ATP-binding protein [Candidatus Methanomethylicia archaeon]MDW7988762.1 ABC transporter ATP-binding protein [Nitrososphaerota archaeon]